MANSVTYTCTALAGVNKAGKLPRDADGYYEVVLGALDVWNSAGEWYTFNGAKDLIGNSSSALQRRISKGVLRGEYSHPHFVKGMTEEDFGRRIMTIESTLVCVHFKEITLDMNRVKDRDGRPVIAIIGKCIPSGPYAAALERSLENPGENVCFSIRAFTDDYQRNGRCERVLRNIVTWDYVNEGGIEVAQKFMAPSLENDKQLWTPRKIVDDYNFARRTIENIVKTNHHPSLAMEAAQFTAEELCESMGWLDASALPAFAKW